MSEFDRNWEQLAERYRIIETVQQRGFCDITADQIKEVKEPRLMVKHDHSSDRPKVFIDNNLSILPLTRGTYRIGNMALYHSFNEGNKLDFSSENAILVSKPTLETLDFDNITSEAIAINAICASGILSNFLSEEDLVSTVNGRMKTGIFNFKVKSLIPGRQPYTVPVNNSQMEIDGGYEGSHSLCLLEAKNSLRADFLVRQLYYPFRSWQSRVTKKVRPVFLSYSEGVYHLMEYQFDTLDDYSSLHLVNYQKYRIVGGISLQMIIDFCKSAPLAPEPDNVPFPQADTFERVIDLCEHLYLHHSVVKTTVTSMYEFEPRQTDYYLNAALYLRLVERHTDGSYHLTDHAKRLFSDDVCTDERNLQLSFLILQHGAFRDCFLFFIQNEGQLSVRKEFVKILKRHPECRLTESLYDRRAGSVAHWVRWIVDITYDSATFNLLRR